MEELLRQHLLTLADAFAAARSCSLQAVGRSALNDGSFFLRMRAGENFTIKTYDRAVAWFSDNWAPEAVWPAEVPRPDPSTPTPDHTSPAEAA